MPEFAELLAELETYLTSHLALADGLSKAEVDIILQDFPYQIAEEIYWLYQWHNGAVHSESYQDGLVADYIFLSLEEAMQEYRSLLSLNQQVGYPVWQDSWLPIFQFDAQQFYIVHGKDTPESNCGIYDFFMQDGELHLKFSSVRQMIAVLISAYKSGAYQWTDQGLAVDEVKFADILREHHPTHTLSLLEKLSRVETAQQLGAIAHELRQLKDPNTIPFLLKILANFNDPTMQSMASIILGEIKDKSVISALLQCLNRANDHTLKLSLLNALFSLPDPLVIPHLLDHLRDAEISIVLAAVSALSAIVITHPNTLIPAEIITVLADLLQQENLAIKLASAGILCRLGDQAALQVISGLVNHDNLATRLKALTCLVQCPNPQALTIAQSCLSDPNPQMRLTAQNVINALTIYRENP